MNVRAKRICNSCRETVAVKRLFGYRTIEDYVTVPQFEAACYADDSQRKVPLHYCGSCWSCFQRAVKRKGFQCLQHIS